MMLFLKFANLIKTTYLTAAIYIWQKICTHDT